MAAARQQLVKSDFKWLITYTYRGPEQMRLKSVSVVNREDADQSLTLTFNNNTSLRDFFMACPPEWRTLQRYTEIYPAHEQQIDFSKDVSQLKQGHFWISIQEEFKYEKDAELCLSYCEADDHIKDCGQPLEETRQPEFSMHLKKEKNRGQFKQLLAAIQRFQAMDQDTLQEISFYFVTVDDLVAIVSRDGLDAAFAHAEKTPYAMHLLTGLVDHIISNTDASDNRQYEHARDCVDKFVSTFSSDGAVLNKMSELDATRYSIRFSQSAYKEYFLIAHLIRERERQGLTAQTRPLKLFSLTT